MKAVYFAVVAALFVTSVGVGMYFRDNGQKEDSDSPPMDPEVKAMELVSLDNAQFSIRRRLLCPCRLAGRFTP